MERINDLLPKREAFFYLRDQINSELFWYNLQCDLRETGSIYACSIDGLDARGGVVSIGEFAVVTGAPIALKKQVTSDQVARRLKELGIIGNREMSGFGHCWVGESNALIRKLSTAQIRARRLTEGVLLDGLRQWVWKNGIGSINTVTIRGEPGHQMVGQFKWDLCGPSYLLPLKGKNNRGNSRHGFVVADVFAEAEMDVQHIRYFSRKVQTYQKTSNSGPLFPILMAERFTSTALTEGHKIGIVLTTPKNLFGYHVAYALGNLLRNLKDVANIATVNVDELYRLLGSLSEIEGRAGNLRGVLFEMIAGYVATRELGGSVEFGVHHIHPETGDRADLDVVCVKDFDSVHAIECKGKVPGGSVSLDEVNKWLNKLPVIQNYVNTQPRLREYHQTYEIWTTGKFDDDAMEKLVLVSKRRKKKPIQWRDGVGIREIAARRKLKAIGDALDEHFLRHPQAKLLKGGNSPD